ncbi:hemolysin type calcium-binding protein [Stella humosa]|uniref:Hemolysin type calcium-binding protein n=1 Tax=Stella humosa TaxID=94 RepID=A0A3N1KRP9_9PROT|nr:calcium-binding protein [Stella humosa]ROP83271.1 hemolysin type calcium-binding protein [Stella humosa]BBK29946.1 hypothetical protein STHU_05800 [Stella humosa]
MAVISWTGASNLDLKILGQTFDFRSDVLQISDPSLQANQFDLVENGTDLVIVKSRDATGAPLPAASVTYAYIPNMLLRQVGGTDSSPVSSNIVLSNGGQLYIGDRITDTLTDDAGNDATALSTQLQSVQVWGLGGADTISTGDGADRVYGNTGADSISGGAGNDSIYGGQENDTVSGGGGNDNVAGDAGNDQVNGGSGNDILYGGAGNDVIDPDTGNDTIFAGNGNDTVTVGDSDTGNKLIYMDKLQDYVNIISTTGDHVVYLGENNDIAELEANSGDIYVHGDGGNDEIYAQNSGSDTLDGGNDDDIVAILNGSVGKKTLIGGFGDDEISVEDSSGNANDQILPNTQVTVSGGEGDDEIYYNRGLFITDANDGGTDDDYISFVGPTVLTLRDQSLQNIETVEFSHESDHVVFSDGNVAAGGTLTIIGIRGKAGDIFDGHRETDGSFVMFGGDAGDTLTGGARNDTLEGGFGRDLLSGGGGADQFVFDIEWNYDADSDVLADFTGGLDRMVFNGNAFGGMSAVDGYKGTSGAGATANDNLMIATGQGYSTLTQFDSFLSEGVAANGKPGFYIFFNTSTNRAEMYFDTDMTSTDGAVLVATFNNITAVSQLDKLNEGAGGHNSGDFVIL